jgi:hypothetical protein
MKPSSRCKLYRAWRSVGHRRPARSPASTNRSTFCRTAIPWSALGKADETRHVTAVGIRNACVCAQANRSASSTRAANNSGEPSPGSQALQRIRSRSEFRSMSAVAASAIDRLHGLEVGVRCRARLAMSGLEQLTTESKRTRSASPERSAPRSRGSTPRRQSA